MSQDSKMNGSDLNLAIYSFDRNLAKILTVKNHLTCQVVRGGTCGSVIIQLEFGENSREAALVKNMAMEAPSKYIRRHRKKMFSLVIFPFIINRTLVKLMMMNLTSHLEFSVPLEKAKLL